MMHRVFALSALVLLASTIQMMVFDQSDEWRVTQNTFDEIEAIKNRNAQESQKVELKGTGADYQEAVKNLENQIRAKNRELVAGADDFPELRETLRQAENEVSVMSQNAKFRKADLGVASADYGILVRDGASDDELQVGIARYDKLKAEVDGMELDLEQKKATRDKAQTALNLATAERDKFEAELKTLVSNIDLMQKSLDKIQPDNAFSSFKRKIMDWPIIDGFNSPHKIINDWLPDLKQTLGMATTDRYDRCRTCHLGIDRVEAGGVLTFPYGKIDSDDPEDWVRENKFPHPFATHPRPDVYLTAASPHPLAEFGCSGCHDGQGSGTSFHNASHSPNDPHEEHQWHEKYGYSHNHFWEYPMAPKRFRESTCLKCHHNVVELGVNPKYGATAPKVHKGWQLIRQFGCFACHEVRGFDGADAIGPDFRLEPNFDEVAKQMLFLLKSQKTDDEGKVGSGASTNAIAALLNSVVDNPEESAAAREDLRNTFEKDKNSRSDALAALAKVKLSADERTAKRKEIRTQYLSDRLHKLIDGLKDVEIPGVMRKVGPSLRRVGQKMTDGFISYWTEKPQRFRPSTRMPQFFDLTNQGDAHAHDFKPVELAGIAQFLIENSQPTELMSPKEDYQPKAERGAKTFAMRGCLNCHKYDDKEFKGADADFAPDLSRIHEKIRPGKEGFNWLYTWIRNPEKHHARTKMPNLFLIPKGDGASYVDPAADVAAFLLAKGAKEFKSQEFKDSALDELTRLYLLKAVTKANADQTYADRNFILPPEQITGDEIELVNTSAEKATAEQWRRMKLNYVGRRTISRYGCFGCHDIPGYELARPIGTTLQDWARKDTSKLALEHIEEYLHHHGEADGSSTRERVKNALESAWSHLFPNKEVEEKELSAAYFYESLLHHGRPGFLWQKLRQPRSYDYKKIETKGYDERLRMPKFPIDEEQIESIATFVLGLVAAPPAEKYIYKPEGPAKDRLDGERLLEKYNCIGCHMIEMPEIRYGIDPEEITASTLVDQEYDSARDLLLKLKPPRNGLTGKKRTFTIDGEEKTLSVLSFHGLVQGRPIADDDPEFQEFTYDLWETLDVDGKILLPSTRMVVSLQAMAESEDKFNGYAKKGRGGTFAEWLVEYLLSQGIVADNDRAMAWQSSPPPLYKEGTKVQTPWLYQFLKNPTQIRHTTLLRMPRFNMSDAEARSLANYFAAVDGVPYPYQQIPQQESAYLSAMQAKMQKDHPDRTDGYLAESWKIFNAPLCIKCHALGGRPYKATPPLPGQKPDIRGPNLDAVADRLRPDWVMLWLYNPKRVTPFTSMPTTYANIAKNNGKKQMEPLFDGDPHDQLIGVRDALMNYKLLMESEGKTIFEPATPAAAGQSGD